MNTKKIFAVSCCLVALGIVLGAFAAHGLKDKVTAYQLDIFQKGVFYHLIHAIVLVVLTLNHTQFGLKKLKLVMWLMVAGIFLFSGSLYLLATIELTGLTSMIKIIGPITPLGGMCFILAWVVLMFAYNKRPGME